MSDTLQKPPPVQSTSPGLDPDPDGSSRWRMRDVLICVGVCFLILVLVGGRAVREQGEEMQPGVQRDIVMAIAGPAGAIADASPLDDVAKELFRPDGESGDSGPGFAAAGTGSAAGSGAITPADFAPGALPDGPKAGPAELKKLVVTGDSMSQPLDVELGQRLAGDGVKAPSEPHIGSGLSKDFPIDWAKASAKTGRTSDLDATVVFIGANEGFPLPYAGKDAECCSAEWAAAYATRARQVMRNLLGGPERKIYWLLLPLPKKAANQRIAKTVNAAVRVAAAPLASQVRILDMAALFTPKGYRAAMDVGGRNRVVRDPDGIHLNDAGAAIAADAVIAAARRDFKNLG